MLEVFVAFSPAEIYETKCSRGPPSLNFYIHTRPLSVPFLFHAFSLFLKVNLTAKLAQKFQYIPHPDQIRVAISLSKFPFHQRITREITNTTDIIRL